MIIAQDFIRVITKAEKERKREREKERKRERNLKGGKSWAGKKVSKIYAKSFVLFIFVFLYREGAGGGVSW
jgi:hypothetical protein